MSIFKKKHKVEEIDIVIKEEPVEEVKVEIKQNLPLQNQLMKL